MLGSVRQTLAGPPDTARSFDQALLEPHPFWQQNNKPIELWSPVVIDQKIDYIHNNPVEAGFVSEPEHWKYSSAVDISGSKGMLEIDIA